MAFGIDLYPLGARVAEIRQYRGWTQPQLAAKAREHGARVHAVSISRLERAHVGPHKELRDDLKGRTILALALALGCDTDYLLGKTDTPRLDKL